MKNAIFAGFRLAANIWMFLVPMLTAAVIDELHRPGDSIMVGKRILH